MGFTIAWGAIAPLLVSYILFGLLVYIIYFRIILNDNTFIGRYRKENIKEMKNFERSFLVGLTFGIVVNILLVSPGAPKRDISNPSTNTRIENSVNKTDVLPEIRSVPDRIQWLDGFSPMKKE